MPHNLFYNITLTDDSNRDRGRLSSYTSLNTVISCLPPQEKKKKPTSMTTAEGKEYYKDCKILFPIKHFVILYFSTDRGILLL